MSKLIEFATNQTLTNTIELDADGLLRGVGSREVTISSSNETIVRVGSNLINSSGGWDDHREINAVIENIVLKATGAYSTAILLNDVYGCEIRNVAIENATIGIHLTTSTANDWIGPEATHIEHVRMTDVNMGIYFSKGAGTGNRCHTHIEDVGIALKATDPIAGIGIDSNCKVSSPFINANVWSSEDSYGMYVNTNSEMHRGIINFSHTKTSGPAGGQGVVFGENATDVDNHNFYDNDYDEIASYGFFLGWGVLDNPTFNLGDNEITEIQHDD